MKFLPPELERANLIPINVQYYQPLYGDFQSKDLLTIVYKDLDTMEKHVYEIEDPPIEIFIVKPECRDFTHNRNYIEMEKCFKLTVPYRNRWREAAKVLGLSGGASEAKTSPYVYNADIPIETYYLINFIREYPTDKKKSLSIGKFDIETDMIRHQLGCDYGEAPINAITYIHMDTKNVYTLVLIKDDLPSYPKDSPEYNKTEEYRAQFYEQAKVVCGEGYIVNRCKETFGEAYPDHTFTVLFYDNEKDLLVDTLSIINSLEDDFIGAWNIPFDLQSIIERMKRLGLNLNEVFCSNRVKDKRVLFKEDRNHVVHKRRHDIVTGTLSVFEDDMVNYGGIRSTEGVIPSYKLNNIAKEELEDEKLDYSEVSDIVHLYYDDLAKFILYNIKDVLLLEDLERKNNDIDVIYSRMYEMAVLPKEAFTTTKVVWHSLIKFMYDENYAPGINMNRGSKGGTVGYEKFLQELDLSIDDLDENESIFELDDFEEDEEDDEEEGKSKKKKYAGAFVMNPLHMEPTGVKVMGNDCPRIHDNVADEDVSSEYPTNVIITNASNETLVGKVFLEDPDSINQAIPTAYEFKGKDEAEYKFNISNFLTEVYMQGDHFNLCETFLDMPSPDEVLAKIDEIIKGRN